MLTRRLRLLARLVTMLILLTLLVFWLRSYYTLDEWSMTDRKGQSWAVVSFQGAVHIIKPSPGNGLPGPWKWDATRLQHDFSWANLYAAGTVTWHFLGMREYTLTTPSLRTGRSTLVPWLTLLPYQSLAIPYWYALPPTIGLSVLWLTPAIIRWRRRLRNCCQNCGYDLRASGERCPECGVEIAKAAV